MDATYSKHKDRTPEQTVAAIKSILDGLGIQTEVVGHNHPFQGTYSNHVQIVGTKIGSNGKGTTESYALASGYAELIERLQNGMAAHRQFRTQLFQEYGFYRFADERLASAEEVLDDPDGIASSWFDYVGLEPREERLELLRLISQCAYARDDGKSPVIPYIDVFNGGITWIPMGLMDIVMGTNGLSAGNTMDEALIQALSEIYERYAQRCIVREQLTPPAIPREYLELAGLRETIADIERGGRYRVSVLDCSLGRGYPVAASIIRDLTRGTFGVRFGSHPSFAVAVERTLTEAYQGRTAEQVGSCNCVAPYDEVVTNDNFATMVVNGGGLYPASILHGKPDWQFEPWPDAEGLGNDELLTSMMDLLRRENRTLLVRDNSHLGFPAYSVIVPGMNEVPTRSYGERSQSMRLARVVGSFPHLAAEEEEVLIEKAVLLENRNRIFMRDLFGRPLANGTLHPARVFGFLQLKHGAYESAAAWFERLSKDSQKQVAALYWEAMANYARWLGWGMERDEALALVGQLYPAAIARKLPLDTEPESIMERNFPSMNCRDSFGCDECQAGETGACCGKVELDVFGRIHEAMAESTVSQEALAHALRHRIR